MPLIVGIGDPLEFLDETYPEKLVAWGHHSLTHCCV